MQIQGGGVSNLLDIPTRNHYDLQNLNHSDDHLLYVPANAIHNGTTPLFGKDAAKPATPTDGMSYIATDTKMMYYCYSGGVWTLIQGVVTPHAMEVGDVLYSVKDGFLRLTAGQNGQQLTTHGAGVPPSWVFPNNRLYNDHVSAALPISATPTNVTTFPINAGVLGTTNVIRIRYKFSIDTIVTPGVFSFVLNYGSAGITFPVNLTGGVGAAPQGEMDVLLMADGVTGQQYLEAYVKLMNTTDIGSGQDEVTFASATIATDSTVGQNMSLVANISAGSLTYNKQSVIAGLV